MAKETYTPAKARELVDIVKTKVASFSNGVEGHMHNDVVLVIGSSRAGKSTLMNMLAGRKMAVSPTKINGAWRLDVANQDYAGEIRAEGFRPIEIGHEGDAKTEFPNYFVTTNGQQFWDCPGFRDSRGVAYEISNMYYVNHILKRIITSSAGSVKFIIVQSAGGFDARGTSFKDSINVICKLFASIPPKHIAESEPESIMQWTHETMTKLIDATTFVFTKIDEEDMAEPNEYLTDIFERIVPKGHVNTNNLEERMYLMFLKTMQAMHIEDNSRVNHSALQMQSLGLQHECLSCS